MDEFSRIATFFAPLASGYDGAFSLKDDAAQLTTNGKQTVITQDTLMEHVHFKGHEPAHLIAKKALRMNLSDLAAKGAMPHAYLLSLSLPSRCSDEWLEAFANGLAEDQERYHIQLIGGDSTASKHDIAITITAIGTLEDGQKMIRRNSAKAGDVILVSGTIGDAGLGLKEADSGFLLDRYQLPQPRTTLTPLLQKYATAALDVSDGVLQDVKHLLNASGLGGIIALDALPLSNAAIGKMQDQLTAEKLLTMATSGDDYEILCTAPADQADDFITAAKLANIRLTHIGKTSKKQGLSIEYSGAELLLPERLGYQHAR